MDSFPHILGIMSPHISLDRPSESDRLDTGLLALGGVLVLGALAPMLDTTIVAVGVDRLAHVFDSPLATLQWVATGYLLAVATVTPLAGWAVDRLGDRRLWTWSLAAFAGTSVACALAWSDLSLIAFRVLQGVSGGLVIPVGQVVLARAAGPRRVGRMIALTQAPTMLAPIAGPVLGGVIVDHLDWRWLFLVNVPVGLLAVLLLRRTPDVAPSPPRRTRLDVRGVTLLPPGLAALLYGVVRTGEGAAPTDPAVVLPILAGTALVAAYGVHALRTRTEPLIDVRLFRSTRFTMATLTLFLVGASVFGSTFLVPLYPQAAYDASAAQAGLFLAPQGLGAAVSMTLAGRYGHLVGPRLAVTGGMALAALGSITFTQLDVGVGDGWLALALAVRGFGMGTTVLALGALYQLVGTANAARAASVAAVLNTLGGSLGTAVLAVALDSQIAAGTATPTAFATTFWWVVGFCALGALPALFLPGRRVVLATASGYGDQGPHDDREGHR
jgi:EmrB/QacA subfamily drug resistance transporter